MSGVAVLMALHSLLDDVRRSAHCVPGRTPRGSPYGRALTCLSVGQRLRKSQNSTVSLSLNHCRAWGKYCFSALIRRLVMRTLSPTNRRRCSTSCTSVRIGVALRLERFELFAVAQQQLERELGIGGIVLGTGSA